MVDKMKIAILSMQKVVNFGSVLQAYSLREIIRGITGEEPAFLDIDYSDSVPRIGKKPQDNRLKAYRKNGILAGLKRKWFRKKLLSNNEKIRQFMRDELRFNDEDNNRHYDLVVVGSDEVFNNTHSEHGLSLQLYGNIKQASNAITYAAAAGATQYEDIPKDSIKRVQDAMKHFSAVSVRDDATYNLITNFYNGQIEHHLDPVLVGPLGDRPHKNVRIKNYLLVYAYGERIRDMNEIEAIRSFAKKNHLKTVAVGGVQFWCDLFIDAAPFELLDYFYHAKYIVTDTFHGTVFSIINKAQFAVFIRPSNKEKMKGLLSDIELGNRVVESPEMLEDVLLKNIDYSRTDEILIREKERTREYLRRYLCNG